MKIGFSLKYLCAFAAIFAVELAIALFARGNFIRGYLGDVLVVVLIYCLVKTFLRSDVKLLPLWIFLFAVLVEAGQYLNVAGLLGIGERSAAGIIIGSVFDARDIACYFVGCAGTWAFEAARRRRSGRPS